MSTDPSPIEQPMTTFWTYAFPALCGLLGALIAGYFSRRTNGESNQTNLLAQAVDAWQKIAEAAREDYRDIHTRMEEMRRALEEERRSCDERIADLNRKFDSFRQQRG